MFSFNLVVMASLSSGTSDRVTLTKTTDINLDIGVWFRVTVRVRLNLERKAANEKGSLHCQYLAESIVRLCGGSVSIKAPQFTIEPGLIIFSSRTEKRANLWFACDVIAAKLVERRNKIFLLRDFFSIFMQTL